METNSSAILISYSFDEDKGEKLTVFSKKVMQSSGHHHCIPGLSPFLIHYEVLENRIYELTLRSNKSQIQRISKSYQLERIKID